MGCRIPAFLSVAALAVLCFPRLCGAATVFLKDGGVLRGTLDHQADTVAIRFSRGGASATVVIRRAEIVRISNEDTPVSVRADSAETGVARAPGAFDPAFFYTNREYMPIAFQGWPYGWPVAWYPAPPMPGVSWESDSVLPHGIHPMEHLNYWFYRHGPPAATMSFRGLQWRAGVLPPLTGR